MPFILDPLLLLPATIKCRDHRQQVEVGCNGWEQRKETPKENRSRWLYWFCISKVRHTRGQAWNQIQASLQKQGSEGMQGVNRNNALSSFAEWVCSAETVHRFWAFENPQQCLPAISCLSLGSPWCCVYLNCLFGLCFVYFLWFAPVPPTEISELLSPRDK